MPVDGGCQGTGSSGDRTQVQDAAEGICQVWRAELEATLELGLEIKLIWSQILGCSKGFWGGRHQPQPSPIACWAGHTYHFIQPTEELLQGKISVPSLQRRE